MLINICDFLWSYVNVNQYLENLYNSENKYFQNDPYLILQNHVKIQD